MEKRDFYTLLVTYDVIWGDKKDDENYKGLIPRNIEHKTLFYCEEQYLEDIMNHAQEAVIEKLDSYAVSKITTLYELFSPDLSAFRTGLKAKFIYHGNPYKGEPTSYSREQFIVDINISLYKKDNVPEFMKEH